jgi:hypothetical protein
MKEIRAILTDQGCRFADRSLKWGANLSDYQDLFNDSNLFIGIELTTDVTPPVHYEVIDHHNENSDMPSSIEQLAHKLGIVLDHRQQLVAANDSGYIPAMVAMGATKEEIEEIRKLDREAQGVTEIDEQLAQESIQIHLSITGYVTVVKSLTSRFSAITDRLYPCPRLLVYTDRELTYYGTGAGKLQYRFPDLVKGNKVYFGGGPDGFFGIKPDLLSIQEPDNIRDAIVGVINQDLKL